MGKYSEQVYYHQLQAIQKFKDKIFETDCIRHLNGDSIDNSFSNIGLGTFSDNNLDIPKKVRIKNAIHASSFKRKLSEKEIVSLYYDKQNGLENKKLAQKYNISESTISRFFKTKYVQEILKKNDLT